VRNWTAATMPSLTMWPARQDTGSSELHQNVISGFSGWWQWRTGSYVPCRAVLLGVNRVPLSLAASRCRLLLSQPRHRQAHSRRSRDHWSIALSIYFRLLYSLVVGARNDFKSIIPGIRNHGITVMT